MKIPHISVKLLLLPAAILGCLLLIQACKDKTAGFPDPGDSLQLATKEHVEVGCSEQEFIEALQKSAKSYEVDYCNLKPDGSYCCDCITPDTIQGILDKLKTNKSQGANCVQCPGADPAAIHVSQWIDFANGDKLREFLSGLCGRSPQK